MKKINSVQMIHLKGGASYGDFCKGFVAVAAVYQVGVWANLWNPVGWGTLGVGIAIGASCAAYGLS